MAWSLNALGGVTVTRHRVFIVLIFLEDPINVHGESANVCYCRTYDCIVLVFVGFSHD